MLSRRFLRIKAMQAVYAYRQKQESNFNLSKDFIGAQFEPDLNSMEKPNLLKLAADKDKALRLFGEAYKSRKIAESDDEYISEVTVSAVNRYHEQLFEDRQRIHNQMLSDAENIELMYLQVLVLLDELAGYFEEMSRKSERRSTGVHIEAQYKFKNNLIINGLRINQDFLSEKAKRNLTFKEEHQEPLYKKFFNVSIKEDERFIEYCKTLKQSFDKDKAIITHLVKNVLFKNEEIIHFFEEFDPHWEENEHIVKSLCLKTFKQAEIGIPINLVGLSDNWEDDKSFFEKLFTKTLEYDEEIDELLIDKLRNWDIERVAMMDKVILEMAVAEMINFPSIPVKVTINEFIELSKNYSTPKSKQFINGILDVVSKELQQNGRIKKSGRGLIDN